MEYLETDERCDQCKKSFKIPVKDFEQIMKDGAFILCPDCETKIIDEQAEAEKPSKRCFEYETVSIKSTDFDYLGRNGWELVAIDNGQAYFKREYYHEEI